LGLRAVQPFAAFTAQGDGARRIASAFGGFE
jgi:hypothetical protein